MNTRDLGGVAVGAGRVAPAALVRSDCVSRLRPSGWQALLDHGVRTIVDLRAEDETQADPVPVPVGVAYRHVPIIDAIAAEEDALPDPPPQWEDAYRTMLRRFQPGFAAAVIAVVEAEPGGVLVQCRLGRDRTGMVVALLLLLAGASEDEVNADYELSQVRLGDSFAASIAAEPNPVRRRLLEWHRAQPPDLMRGAIAELRKTYGGAESYLAAGGAPADVEARVQARLVGPKSVWETLP